ncbi:MAG: hypothetical protein ACRC33_07785 [Gemmataceae bacterium]
MSVNRHRPHVYLIPEDEAESAIALGFLDHGAVRPRVVQLMPYPGGWPNVLSRFEEVYVPLLRGNAKAHVVMLIDFDDVVESRRERFEQAIPADLRARTFVIGPKREPEELRRECGKKYEAIGRALAEECMKGELGLWVHPHLIHHGVELSRMLEVLRPFVFSDS